MIQRVCQYWVRASAWIAPADFRGRWREEWLAEVSAAAGSRRRLLTRVAGAPIDALAAHWTVGASTPHRFTTSRPTRADLVLAFRQIHQAPLLNLAAVMALAVGIGLATAAFAGVLNLFYGDLPVDRPDQVVKLHDFDQVGQWGLMIDYAEFDRRRRALRSFSAVAAYNERSVLVAAPGRAPELRRAAHVTANLGGALRQAPQLGRDFTAGDETPGAGDVVLISDRLFERLFDRDPAAIGRVMRIDERPHDVIGVMPRGWRFPLSADLWIPLRDEPVSGASPLSSLLVTGRLADGVTLERATAEVRAVAAPWTQQPGREHVSQVVIPFTASTALPAVVYAVWGIVAALVLLLLVSAANVANVVMARALSRRREMAVRSALGASRARLVAQVVTEALVLGALATVLGALAARWGLRWLEVTVTDMPFWVRLDLDGRVLLFSAAIGLLASIVAGLGPALRVTRGSMYDVLREHASSLSFGRLSGALIVCETAVAVGLLTGAVVLGRSLWNVTDHAARLPAGGVLVAQLYFGQPPALAGAGAPADPDVRRAHWREYLDRVGREQARLVDRLSAEPGLRAVSLASHFPGDQPGDHRVEVRDADGAPRAVTTRVVSVGTRYLDVLRTRPVLGRFFHDDELAAARPVALVNEPFVRKYFAGANPLGRLVRTVDAASRGAAGEGPWREIVGVLPDLAVNAGDPGRADGIYLPLSPDTVIRVGAAGGGHPLSLMPALHREALALEPRPQVQWTTTLEAQLQEPMTAFRAFGLALSALGAVAVLLTCLGTYAIVAFSVAQRRREIAIRVAIGAGRRDVAATVMAATARQLALGSLLGGALAIGIQQLLGAIPIVLADNGVTAPALIVGMVAVSGVLACAGPLRRALSLHPGDWLKE